MQASTDMVQQMAIVEYIANNYVKLLIVCIGIQFFCVVCNYVSAECFQQTLPSIQHVPPACQRPPITLHLASTHWLPTP